MKSTNPVIGPSTEFHQSSDRFGETWLSVDEVAGLGKSRRRVLIRIASGKWESREAGLGPNGKPAREILLSSLPRELQERWAAQGRQKAVGSQEEEAGATPAVPADTESRLNDALKRYAPEVREAFLNEARRLASIVERYDAIEVKRVQKSAGQAKSPIAPAYHAGEEGSSPSPRSTSQYEFVPEVLALCKEAICTDPVVLAYYEAKRHAVRKGSNISRAQCPSPHTLDGWSRRFKTDGLLTFLRSPSILTVEKQRRDRRRANISAEAIEWVNANWRGCATARALYRKLQKQARKHNWKIPSEAYIYRLWRRLPKVITTSRHSNKAYVDKCAPYVPRDNSDCDALQIVCGDHSERDVTVRLRDGSLARPWLTLWQDIRTGLLWGWHLDLTPSSRTAGLAYANGVRTFGAQPLSRPEEDYWSYIYTDQGKDYKSHNIDGKVLTFKNAMALEGGLEALRIQRRVGLIDDLGLKHILSRGYNAREKPVERVHKDISAWEASTFREVEYCGADAKSKPDAWREAWSRHQRLLKKARGGNHLILNESPFMTMDDYREALAGWITTEYNVTAHERTALDHARIVPIDEYHRLYTTRYEISEEALALFLMKAERRTVGKNGVWLHRRNWFYLDKALWPYKGMDVEVRYSEDDYNRCWVVTPNGPIIEAQRITASTIRNPNKQTHTAIKEQAAHERKAMKTFNFITQSMLRGETTEDRVAAMMIEPEEAAEAIAAVGGISGAGHSPARVHQFTRMDRPKLRSVGRRLVTAEEVSSVDADEEIFSESGGRGKVKEFDFDE